MSSSTKELHGKFSKFWREILNENFFYSFFFESERGVFPQTEFVFDLELPVDFVPTNNDGEVLLIRRAHDPAKGKLGMPGGFIDPGESAEEALRREVLEEVGLQIRNMKYLMSAPNCYAYRGIDIPVLDMFYTAQVKEGEIRTEDGEVTEWYWTRLNDEVLAEMAFPSNRGALAYYRGLINASGVSS